MKHCVYCNEINEAVSKKCKKCRRKLDDKSHLFKDYLINKIKDKYKGDLEDKITSIAIQYLKSHLYGFIFTCSLILVGVPIVLQNLNGNTFIEKVDQKPEILLEKIPYVGEGWSSEEVVQNYMKAVQNQDWKTIKGLQLENYYPDIYASLREIDQNIIENQELQTMLEWETEDFKLFSEKLIDHPILEHEYVENGEFYFRQLKDFSIYKMDGYYNLVPPEGVYHDYSYVRYQIRHYYCSYNQCKNDTSFDDILDVAIELLEVNGNYYVIGETKGSFSYNFSMLISHELFLKNHGDTSNTNFEELHSRLFSCKSMKECIN